MSDPTPPPGDRWPSDPSRAARQDHAVLAWLVVEADLPNAVHGHLVDALVAWAPLMGEHLFPTEPEAGVDADLRQVLQGDVVAPGCAGCRCPVGGQGRAERGARQDRPAMQALGARRAPRPALPEPRSPGR